jgi:hypothetical protein
MSALEDDLAKGAPRLDKQLLLKTFTEVSVRPGHKAIAKPGAIDIESEVSGEIPDGNRPPDDEQ